MNKKNLKIVRLYTISLICIVSYVLLENSYIIPELVEKSSKGRYNGFVTFIFSGFFKYGLLVIGICIIVILSFILIKEKYLQNSDKKLNKRTNKSVENRTKRLNTKYQQANRKLRLVVAYDFGQDLKTISERATVEIIKRTMKSIDWNKFHIVQLEDDFDNALHVSGSLIEDGLASGFTAEDNHILMVKPIKTVEQMTGILLDFLKGEEVWRNKYKYE